MWEVIGNKESVFLSDWPSYDKSKLVKDTINIVVQVNGKLRGQINVSSQDTKDSILEEAKQNENVRLHIKDKNIIKEIFVPNKLINFVVK